MENQVSLHSVVKSLIDRCKEICKTMNKNKGDMFMKELNLFDALCSKLTYDALVKLFDNAESTVSGLLTSFMEHELVSKQFSIKTDSKKVLLRFYIFLEHEMKIAAETHSNMFVTEPEKLSGHIKLMMNLLSVYGVYKEEPKYTNAVQIYYSMMNVRQSVDTISQLFGGNNDGIQSGEIGNLISTITKVMGNGMKDDNGNPISIKELLDQNMPPDLMPEGFRNTIANIATMLTNKMQDGELNQEDMPQYISQMIAGFQDSM